MKSKRVKKRPWFRVKVTPCDVEFTIVGKHSYQTFHLDKYPNKRWTAKMLRRALRVLKDSK